MARDKRKNLEPRPRLTAACRRYRRMKYQVTNPVYHAVDWLMHRHVEDLDATLAGLLAGAQAT